MGIINKIKGLVGGDPHEETARAAGAPADGYLGTQLGTPGADADVFTPETDPTLESVEAAGSPTPPRHAGPRPCCRPCPCLKWPVPCRQGKNGYAATRAVIDLSVKLHEPVAL
ncbi:MAG: hypothetical protein JWM58_2323 [Rhizobium sp.]|nr:hypothetical protein [Rhizobium sp.]